jgi:hypothetical protein
VGLQVRKSTIALLAAAALVSSADAQGTRKPTNIGAILGFPGYYHGKPVVLTANVGVVKDELRIADDNGASIRLIFKGSAPDGLDEIRGEFWDIGRMKADDVRLTTFDLRTTFKMDPEAAWPRPGEVTAFIASSVTPAQLPANSSIRSIVLFPSRYIDQKVTITGQFSGRNLLGDLPDAPAKSRYDFVMRSADAAIWIINMRPKVRDSSNREIELGLDARIETSRWLEVKGTMKESRGLLLLDAEAGSLKLAKPPAETTVVTEEPIHVPAGPPPEVVFSTPTDDESDVLQNTNVRMQFSRDLDAKTLKGHIKASYLESQTVERGEPVTPSAEFTTNYLAANRVLELKFVKPLERFRTITIVLDEGILGTDGQPLKPYTLTFSIGGS